MQASRLLSSGRPAVAFQGVKPCVACKPVSRQHLTICASGIAAPVTLPYKAVDGSDKGAQQISLKVAEDTATAVVHRYMVMALQNARRGTASTLTRSEVRGGGRKPYAQKGTGNARRGSSVSPLFPGGGIAFGPKPRDWSIKMNKKERRLALATALQSASADILVVESLKEKVTDRKTKALLDVMAKLGVDTSKKTLLVLAEPHDHIMLAGRNVENLMINTASAVNILHLLKADRVVIEDEALEFIHSVYGGKTEDATETEQ